MRGGSSLVTKASESVMDGLVNSELIHLEKKRNESRACIIDAYFVPWWRVSSHQGDTSKAYTPKLLQMIMGKF